MSQPPRLLGFDSLTTRVTFTEDVAQWAETLRPPTPLHGSGTPLATALHLQHGSALGEGTSVQLSWSRGQVAAYRSGDRITIPGVLAFEVRVRDGQPNLTHIELGPDAADRPEDVWLGLWIAFAETQRAAGWLGLHAALLEINGRCLAITGPSGAGKSTATLRLLERGAGIVAEDNGWLSPDGRLVGWDQNLRLRPGTLEQFAPSLRSMGLDAHGKEVVQAQRVAGGRLDEVWVLGMAHGERLSAVEGVRAWWDMSGLPITPAGRRGAAGAVARLCAAPPLSIRGLDRTRLLEALG